MNKENKIKIERFYPLILIFAFFCLVLALVFMHQPQRVNAQCASPSSCKTCHETQAQKPVNGLGLWHQQHAAYDFCEACHGGSRNATEKAAAHNGIVTRLEGMPAKCASCHVNDCEKRLEPYASEKGIADASSLLANQPPASSGPSLMDNGKPAGPTAPLSVTASTSTQPAPDNTLNMLLLILLVLGVVGGAGYIVWNEKRLYGEVLPSGHLLVRFAAFIRRETWSPYAAGILLGVTAILAVWVGNHLLSAAGPVALLTSLLVNASVPEDVMQNNMYFRYVYPPAVDWPLFLLVGTFFGGMLGALTSGTLRLRWSDDPLWKRVFGSQRWKRFVIGFIGAVILQYGASIAGGCTSGLAISGGMLLAPSAFLFMAGMFAAGIAVTVIIYRRLY